MPTTVIAGVGPGLGASIARTFADAGHELALLARTRSYIEELAAELPTDARAVPTNLANPDDIEAAFDRTREAFGGADVLVHHASAAPWKGLQECTLEEYEHAYDVGPRAALLCSQEAVSDMLRGDSSEGGTVIFTGATTSVRGREGAVGFSMAKFGVRGLAESMARELGPDGIHVAHVVIDGGILTPGVEASNPEEYLDPDAIAESYLHLVQQDRSAWTLELDLRPHVEEF